MANPTMKVKLSQLTAGALASLALTDLMLVERAGVSYSLTGQKLVDMVAAKLIGPSAFADPNNNVTATAPALLYTDVGTIWIKTDEGSSNTGWVQIIG